MFIWEPWRPPYIGTLSKFMYPLVKQKKIEIVTRLGVKGDAEDGESGEDEVEDEDEVLQDSEPGPLSKDPKDVEEVLNVISQSIYREGQGQFEHRHNWRSIKTTLFKQNG